MNWLAVGRYVVARTREPSTVHRAVAAIGGFIAAFSLDGSEKWVALVVSASALIGILLPDSETFPTGFGDKESGPVTEEKPDAVADSPSGLPPVELVGRPAVPLADQAGAVAGDAGPGADVVQPVDFVRQPVPPVRRTEPDTRPNLGGFGDRD